MAAIAITTADFRVVEEPHDQWTAYCAVAVTAGQVIHLNASGKWVLALGTNAANAAGCYIAAKSAGANQPLTGVRHGKFTGIDPALAPPAAIYLSDTAGGMDTAAGTVSTLIGRVVEPGVASFVCPV